MSYVDGGAGGGGSYRGGGGSRGRGRGSSRGRGAPRGAGGMGMNRGRGGGPQHGGGGYDGGHNDMGGGMGGGGGGYQGGGRGGGGRGGGPKPYGNQAPYQQQQQQQQPHYSNQPQQQHYQQQQQYDQQGMQQQQPHRNSRGGGGGGGGGGFQDGGGQQRNQAYNNGRGSYGNQQRERLFNIEISGYPQDVTPDELQQFLMSHAPPNFQVIKLSYKPHRSYVQVPASFGDDVLAMSHTKAIRPNVTVMIEPGTPLGQVLSDQEREQLRQHMVAQYDTASKSLDMGSCSRVVDLTCKNGVQEMLACIAQSMPELTTINLANNRLVSLSAFTQLHHAAPQLINLSLENNALQQFEQLDYLSAYRSQLHELILQGNPLVPAQNNGPPYALYRQLVSSMFTHLTMLDYSPLSALISFDLPDILSSTRLPPLQGSYFDDAKNAEVSKLFVERYFSLYDTPNGREKLIDVYADTALFSLTCANDSHTAIPPPPYKLINRNALDSAQSSASSSSAAPSSSSAFPAHQSTQSRALHSYASLKQKPLHIAVALSSLPMTQHDVASFTADVLLLPSTHLYITLRGSFIELDTNTLRAFHRVFLLVPPSPQAISRSWPVLIQHDQLFIGASRSLSTTTATNPALLHSPLHNNNSTGGGSYHSPSPAPSYINAVNINVALPLSPTPADVAAIEHLKQITNVDHQTAIAALTQAHGNIDHAYQLIAQALQQPR